MDRGLEILLNAYWKGGQWASGEISKEDFNTAKEERYMFDYPNFMTHNETLDRLNNVLEKISIDEVAKSFLYSLSTRKLEYRSALGSYWYAISVPKHDVMGRIAPICCEYCGWSEWDKKPSKYELNRGVNVYNFERYKWGGVRHTYVNYALFDLEQFLKLPKVMPSKNDIEILSNILKCIDIIEPNDKIGKLKECILKQKIFKTNKNELSELLEILGICGVLSSKEFPCYAEKFVPNNGSRDPIEHKSDFGYPINRWHAKDGVNKRRFEVVFKSSMNSNNKE